MNKNPALTASWFQKRFNVYFRKVVSLLLKVKDRWFRFEWQHRGSSHVHGLIWLEGAPSVDDLDLENIVSIRANLDFWRSRVSANDPGPDLPPAPRHPSSIPHDRLNYTFRELAELLNRVQRHTRCTDAYCLRRPRGSAPDTPRLCRFKFPKELLEYAKLEMNESGHVQLFTARNDPLMHLHFPVLASGWQANTDFSPCTDSHAVATYIAKYVSKAEKPSANFAQVMQGICQKVEADTTGRVIFQKMLGKILTERDWSAQEVCHNLLQCDMTSASREFGTLCLLDDRRRRLRLEDDIDPEEHQAEIEANDWRDQYYKRPPDLEEVSLYAWFLEYRKGKRGGPPVMRRSFAYGRRTIPEVRRQRTMSNGLGRSILFLHLPHRNIGDLKSPEETWDEAYRQCELDPPISHRKDTLPTGHRGADRDHVSGTEFSDEEEEDDREMDDFHLMCQEEVGLEALGLGRNDSEYGTSIA